MKVISNYLTKPQQSQDNGEIVATGAVKNSELMDHLSSPEFARNFRDAVLEKSSCPISLPEEHCRFCQFRIGRECKY